MKKIILPFALTFVSFLFYNNAKAQITLTASATTTNCSGSCTGTVSTNVTGGNPPYTYTWSNGSTVASPTGLCAGTYFVTAQDAMGDTATLSVTVNQQVILSVNAGADVIVCSGLSTTLNATGDGYYYSWSPATGLSDTNIVNPVASPAATTTYTVTASDTNGCSATDMVTVIINDSLSVNAGPDVNLCSGSSTNLNAIGGFVNYVWSPSTGLSNANIPNPVASPTTTTTYTVTVSDSIGSGCSSSTDAVTIVVNAGININAGPDVTICSGTSSNLSASGATSYSWSPSYGLSNANISNPVASPAYTTTYTVTASDSANGCVATDMITVNISPSAIFTGYVLFPSLNVNSGTANAFAVTSGAYTLVSTTAIDSMGMFVFSGLSNGNYIFSAELDTNIYHGAITTYNHSSSNGNSASQIAITCGNNSADSIIVIQTTPLSGPGMIAGSVSSNGTPKTGTVGDPIPGVDITLEQNPGSVLLAQTTTDANGDYVFNNVPIGNYSIYVDVPGLAMSATYSVNITASNSTYTDAAFYVDSSGTIDTVKSVILGHKAQTTNLKNTISVFPNPYNTFTNINYEISEKATVNMEVYNMLGEKITTLVNTSKDAGKYTEKFSAKAIGLGAGVYFVKTNINGKVQTVRLIELN